MVLFFIMTTPENTPLSTDNFTSLSDYEHWASTHWVHPNGTLQAQHHAREKLGEETEELIESILHGSPADIISEAGDVLWTACASGSNADITISEGLISCFPGYFSSDKPISTSEIDSLAATLFNGIDNCEVIEYLHEGERVLGKKAKQWFVLRDSVGTPENTFADAWITLKRSDAVEALTRTTLLVSFIAQQYAGEGLGAVLRTNYQKISQRLQTGSQVTKPPRQTPKQ